MPTRSAYYCLLWLLLWGTALPADPSLPADPFLAVKSYALPNGLRVILLPNPNAGKVYVQVKVEAGRTEEHTSNLGVAHLTEHCVFRDESLGGQTYLDILQKEGADTNGLTAVDQTTYFASLPAARASWLVDLYGRMLRDRRFSHDVVEKSKAEVLLEMDSPRHYTRGGKEEETLGGIFASEFGIPFPKTSVWKTTVSTRRMSERQVQSFFNRYYHPANMVLTAVGGFDEAAMRRQIEAAFGAYSSHGRKERQEPPPRPREKPFLMSYVTRYAPRILVGTKFWQIEAQDSLVLKAYLDHLALRLMKRLRTENGQTYTVSPFLSLDTRRFGFGFISFETTDQKFREIYDYVTDLIRRETSGQEITDENIQGARDLYLARYKGLDNDVRELASLAGQAFAFQVTWGLAATPLQVFAGISNREFRHRLAKLFAPEREFRLLLEPPFFFRGEDYVLMGLSLLYAFFFAHKLFHNEENEPAEVRYVRKVEYGVLTFAVVVAGLVLVVIGCCILFALLFQLERGIALFQTSFLVRDYLQGAYLTIVAVFAVLAYLCLWPRKLSLHRGRLIVKSLGYHSRRHRLDEIVEIRTCRPLSVLWHPWWKTRRTHFGFVRPGVLIRFQSGFGYFLGFRAPERVVKELREHCGFTGEDDQTGTLLSEPEAGTQTQTQTQTGTESKVA